MSNYRPNDRDVSPAQDWLLPEYDNGDTPIDWDSILPPSDEPPPDWKFPMHVLDNQEPDWLDVIGAEAAAAQLGIPFETGQVGYAFGDENSIERFFAEERQLSLLDMEESSPMDGALPTDDPAAYSLPPRQELIARAEELSLYDARFVGRNDLDDQGEVIGHTIECLEIYRDTNGGFSGQALDIAHYERQEDAERDYFELQGSIGDDVPIYAVAALGALVAEQNGLPMDWREATAHDFERYAFHLGLDQPNDMPSEEAAAEPILLSATLGAAGVNLDLVRQQEALEHAQAIEALRRIGLEPSKDFNLHRDSFLDDKTGDRIIGGIFQQDLRDYTRNCQATFVSLQGSALGFEADVTPFGAVGSFEEARASYAIVQAALMQGGPERAVEAMEGIQLDLEREGIELEASTAPGAAYDGWREAGAEQPELLPGSRLDIS